MNTKRIVWPALVGCAWMLSGGVPQRVGAQNAAQLGLFESRGDVGTVLHPGAAQYDPAARTYTITASGENVWGTADAFQFVWKKASGDLSLTADISFPTTTGNNHKKAMLMFRQSLDADSAYADVAAHLDGLTSLQSREQKGAATHEVQASVTGVRRLRIVKRGPYFYMSIASGSGNFQFSGAAMRVELTEPFYVGLGVCSHDKDVIEQAVFSNVEMKQLPSSGARPAAYSTLETITVSSTDRRVAYTATERLEAPTWSKDGAELLFARAGRIARMAEKGAQPVAFDTGSVTRIAGGPSLSPDGARIAFGDSRSAIYVMPLAGGAPARVATGMPSQIGGWSPDGQALLFSGMRNGKMDIYTIPAAGGRPTALTREAGRNEGPEFARDGSAIFFHSDRSGSMQIWRMRPDGTGQEQVTSDDFANIYPHLAPNGRQLAFLSYGKEVKGYPENREVVLRMMNLANKSTTALAKFIGGKGSFEAAPWTPDSRRLTYISYPSFR